MTEAAHTSPPSKEPPSPSLEERIGRLLCHDEKTGLPVYGEKTDLAVARFVELDRILGPIYSPGVNGQEEIMARVDKAVSLIGTMIDELQILDGDDDLLRAFETDIGMCGYYASRALTLALFRLAKRVKT